MTSKQTNQQRGIPAVPPDETPTERVNRITNTPTLVPRADDDPPQPARATKPTKTPKKARSEWAPKATPAAIRARSGQYRPATDLWLRVIHRLVASRDVSATQADNWLRPCELATMELPSGEVIAAALHTPSSFSADHVRHVYAASIRSMLQILTNKQVILFVRGPDASAWDGPPDGYFSE